MNKKEAAKHSPLPWKYEYRQGGLPGTNGWGTYALWDAEDGIVLGDEEGWEGGFRAPSEDDAALIVKAVNRTPAFDALFEAVALMLDAHISGHIASWDNAEEKARAALKLAKEVR